MAVAYRSHTTKTGTESTDFVMTKPTGLQAGDMMIAAVITNGVVPDFSRTGWSKIGDLDNSTNNGTEVFARIADSSDAAATDFTFTYAGSFGGQNLSAILVAYSGSFTSTSNITAIDTSYDADADSDDIGEWTGGITPLADSTLVMIGMASCSNASTSSLSGYAITTSNPTWTERADFGNTSNSDTRMGFADATRPESTATGNYEINFNSTGNVNDAFGVLLSISESVNVTVSPTVITATASVQTPTVSGGATVSPTVVTVTISVQSPTVSTPTPDWTNTDKNNTSWTNLDKT